MKILVYFNSMSAAGGIERVISGHISFMAPMHHVLLVTKDEAPSFFPLPSSISREFLKVDFSMDMRSRWRRIIKVAFSLQHTIRGLRLQLKKFSPDIIYVASPLNLLEVFLAGVSCKRVVVTEHSSYPKYNWIYKIIVSVLYPRVGLLTVPSKTDSNAYLARRIPNAYIPNPLSFYPKETSNLTSMLVLCVGRLTDDKRHDLLLDIWYLSGIQTFGWKLKIIGRGEHHQSLLEKIDRLGIGESVSIQEPTANIQEEFFKASIFLLTSKTEGFGLVLSEAMACGLPCIAFDCPSGPRDIIVDDVNGRLLNEGDVLSYIAALQELAVNHALRVRLGMGARLYVKRFNSEAIGSEFNCLLNKTFA